MRGKLFPNKLHGILEKGRQTWTTSSAPGPKPESARTASMRSVCDEGVAGRAFASPPLRLTSTLQSAIFQFYQRAKSPKVVKWLQCHLLLQSCQDSLLRNRCTLGAKVAPGRKIQNQRKMMQRSALTMLRRAPSVAMRAFPAVRAPLRSYHQVRTTPVGTSAAHLWRAGEAER